MAKIYIELNPKDTKKTVNTEKEEENDDISYDDNHIGYHDFLNVVMNYPKYRYYLISHLCQHIGDWFVRIASLLMVEQMAHNSGSSLAKLALSNNLPKVLFAQIGGVLSDNYDRRILMIYLDMIAGVAVLGYLIAIHYESLTMLYIVSMIRSSISSCYFPVTTGIVPMLIPHPRDLQLAVTMNSWAWCTMAMVGGIIAGTATAYIGQQACYIIDCVTYFLSAFLVYFGISGSFNVLLLRNSSDEDATESQSYGVYQQVKELISYLWECGFGLLVFMKGSASLIWGPEDVIGVLYATVEGDERKSSIHMGVLFSIIGLGCMIGPMLANFITDAKRPITIQLSCWLALVVLTIGWLLISTANTFEGFLLGTLVRTTGSGVAWPFSSLLLQRLTDKKILGRVLAVDFTITTLTESLSVIITGKLSDAGASKQELSLFGAGLGSVMALLWGVYHFVLQAGAAQDKFNDRYQVCDKQSTNVDKVELNPIENSKFINVLQQLELEEIERC